MAGLGFKDFQVGEVLTSADVDGYLMQQSVMRFADAGARGSALGTAPGTAVALAEGMVSYLDDVNRVEVYDGTLWRPTGTILQVVTATKGDTFTTTSTSYTAVTDLSVSITPSSASNKVLLIASVSAHLPASTSLIGFLSLFRGATNLAAATSPGSRIPAFASQLQPDGTFQGRNIYLYAANLVDSPATTSATTYTVQVKASSGGTVYVNRGASDTDDNGHTRGFSSLTAIEVSV